MPSTIVVTSLADNPGVFTPGSDGMAATDTTLRGAITNANPGDVITFHPGLSGAINLSSANGQTGVGSALTLNANLTIQGPSDNSIIVEGGASANDSSNTEVFVVNPGVSAVLNNLVIRNGFAANGGGISNAGTLTLNYDTVSDNLATRFGPDCYGGGVFSTGDLTINNSLIYHNTAPNSGQGGGVFTYGSTATLSMTNTTVTGNFAEYYGGGVSIGGPSTLTNCTIVSNAVPYYGYGGGISSAHAFTLVNSIVSGNSGQAADISCGLPITISNSLIGVDAMLGQLADNGGPTQTMALLPGSPAIDAGDPNSAGLPAFDQRGPGYSRVVGPRVDIGAFEVQAAPISDTTAIAVAAAYGTYGGTITLTATLTDTTTNLPLSGQSVSFTLGNTTVGTVATDANGMATLSNVGLAGVGAGTYPAYVGAGFAGTPNYFASGGTSTLTVAQAATATAVTSSLNPSPYNEAVTFTATVTSAAPTPGGTVSFYDGSTLLGSAPLDLSGRASFSTAAYALPVGDHSITAVYNGGANYLASPSDVLTQHVLTAQQQVALLFNEVNALVTSGALGSGNGNALQAKLNAAVSSLNAGNKLAGVNQLNAFINQVHAFVNSHRLTPADANLLINAADDAIASV